eukprot:scaffold1.g5500.t1
MAASRVFLSLAWLIPRWLLWFGLFAVALWDGVRHRSVAATAGRLFWLLVASCGLFLIRDTFLLAFAIVARDGWVSRASFDAYIVFSDVAESWWLFILLAIAAGYCITRRDLGLYKDTCIFIPSIYLVTSLIVDFIMYYSNGVEAFTESAYDPGQGTPDTTGVPIEAPDSVFWLYIICGMVNVFALAIAQLCVLDIIKKERLELEGGDAADAYAAAAAAQNNAAAGVGPGGLPLSSRGQPAASGEVGQVELPRHAAAMLLEEGQNASHLYGDVHTGDLDAPKTVQDKVELRDKLRLIRRFFYAFCVYCFTAFATLLIPAFVPVDPTSLTPDQAALTTAFHAMLIVLNAVLWLFMAALLWTFRLRAVNQYLMADEEEAEDELGTALDDGPTTELGVLPHRSHPPAPSFHGGPAEPAAAARFSLAEEEEEEEGALPPPPGLMAPAGGGGAQQGQPPGGAPSLNTAAARAGVVVEVLPSPSVLPLPPPPLPPPVKERQD